jgi:hypothetical protein
LNSSVSTSNSWLLAADEASAQADIKIAKNSRIL